MISQGLLRWFHRMVMKLIKWYLKRYKPQLFRQFFPVKFEGGFQGYSQKQIESLTKQYDQFLKQWNSLTEYQKNDIISGFKTYSTKNKSVYRFMDKINNQVNRITTKMTSGRLLTTLEKQFIETYQNFFVGEKNYLRASKVNSSWLIKASYTKSSKVMKVWKKRGTGVYHYFNVPIWVWIHLTTLPAHAGRWWWKSWIWKYSANQARWVPLKLENKWILK